MATGENVLMDPIKLDDETRDQLEQLHEQKKVVKFDWENRWLKGEEYFYILANMENYAKNLGIEKFGVKKHPENIYIEPINGLLYFVKGNSIGSEFGFPRLGIKKRYKWKKMNFTTDLPKRDPLVSYIVASAVKCEKFFPGSSKDGPCYRMHAVILKKRKQPVYPGCYVNPKCYTYILCHVRKVKFRKGGNGDEGASERVENGGGPNNSNPNEETKVAKTGNKRGRPRKNPLVPKEEGSTQKSKRGRKPKKLYDMEPVDNGGGNLTFNDSENKEEDEGSKESDHHIERSNESSPMGVIGKTLKMAESNTFSFDSLANFNNTNNLSIVPRKQSLTNPFDKFCGDVPSNMDLLHEHGRSRRVSSIVSPYNPAATFSNIVSPSPFRGTPMNPISEFKSGGFTMRKMSTNQNPGENDSQKKLNDIIAESFKTWNPKPGRKDTEDVDFSGQEPILNLFNKAANKNDGSNNLLESFPNSILSPDYKPRSLSINSNGFQLPPHSLIQARNSNPGWESQDKQNSNNKEGSESRKNGEGPMIKISPFGKSTLRAPIARKKTMLDPPSTVKERSPLMFPKFSAAFKPFKKRSLSVADPSSTSKIEPVGLKKREEKAARKLEEAAK